MTNYKIYVIFNAYLAHELIQHGHVMSGTGVNEKNPAKRVYFFNDSLELRKIVDEFTIKRKQMVKN